MLDLIYHRIDKIDNIKNINNVHVNLLFSHLINDHLERILIGSPTELISINNQINQFIQFFPDLKVGIEFVFNYDWFISKTSERYCAYDLAEALDINTCVYCNRNYISTVIHSSSKDKITRPQFDHYFDKANNSLLALSFFNLIPSCSVCNSSVKNIKKFSLNDFSHPYIDDIVDQVNFSYQYSSNTKTGLKIKVSSKTSKKAQNTLEAFAIEEIYNSHASELLDLLKTKQYFSNRYLDILLTNILKDVIISKNEMYRLVFGVEFDSSEFHNRPFSKFKKDILKELEII
jgi:hypothetical protein